MKYNYTFDCSMNSNSAYLLGAMMADGCVSLVGRKKIDRVMYLASIEREWLELISPYFGTDLSIVSKPGHYRLYVHLNKIVDWFISYGCVPRKSLILEFPAIPDVYMRDFIRGCWDGDGWITISKSKRKYASRYKSVTHINDRVYCGFASASKVFIDRLSSILHRYGIRHSYYVRDQRGRRSTIHGREVICKQEMYTISTSGKASKQLLDWLYYNECALYLPRKRELALRSREFHFK